MDADDDGEDDVARISWRSDEEDENELYVDPGEYEHRAWAFTKPGVYQLQVHGKGHPSKKLRDEEDIPNWTTTSVVRYYNFHVGLMADLSATVTADDAAPDPGDTVTLTVKATNGGAGPSYRHQGQRRVARGPDLRVRHAQDRR